MVNKKADKIKSNLTTTQQVLYFMNSNMQIVQLDFQKIDAS